MPFSWVNPVNMERHRGGSDYKRILLNASSKVREKFRNVFPLESLQKGLLIVEVESCGNKDVGLNKGRCLT